MIASGNHTYSLPSFRDAYTDRCFLVTRCHGELGVNHVPVSYCPSSWKGKVLMMWLGLPLCCLIQRRLQIAIETVSPMSWHMSWLTNGSAIWSLWTGGASFGSTKASRLGSDGSPSTIFTQVCLPKDLCTHGALIVHRLERLGSVCCTFKIQR